EKKEKKEKKKEVPTEKKKGIFARFRKAKPPEGEGPEMEPEVPEERKKGLFERLSVKGEEEEEEDITSILDEDMVKGLK
ncbi:MAG: hypothetical protein HXS54_03815, partial [Theionarchaea archaeon]|nr:hypothetical protein [Theionarchaea archaeon]